MSAITESVRIIRLENHQWRETQDGKIMVFPRYKGRRPDFHGFFEFGEFEAMVWRALKSKPLAGELRDTLLKQLVQLDDVEEPSAEELWSELVRFLQELIENGLVQIEPQSSDTSRPDAVG